VQSCTAWISDDTYNVCVDRAAAVVRDHGAHASAGSRKGAGLHALSRHWLNPESAQHDAPILLLPGDLRWSA
jgi:hypothetical protein